MNTMDVGCKLVEYCKAGQHRRAVEELYDDNCQSVEAMPEMPAPGSPRGLMGGTTTGKDMILKESDWFFQTNEIHGGDMHGPYPFGSDKFICHATMACTPKAGPMAGQRMDMAEACVYTVKNGKVTEARFCYDMPGC